MFLFELALFVAIAIAVKVRFQRSRVREMVDKFDGPPTWPFLGNMLTFLGSPADMLAAIYTLQRECRGECFRLWLLHKPVVAVTALEDIRIVSKVPQKDQLYEYLTSILGDGLITTNGRKWKRSRRLLDPMFNTTGVVVNFLEIFNRQNILLADTVERNEKEDVAFDMWPYIFRMSLQTIYETAVGSQIRVDDQILHKLQDGILKACHLCFKRCYQPWLQPTLVFKAFLYAKGYGNVFEDVMKFHRQMIADKKRRPNEQRADAEKTVEGKSVLDTMLAGQQSEELSDEDIANEVVTLLFAGTETSSVVICFTLMMLAKHPDVQRKVYEEIREKTPDDERAHLSLKHLAELTLLEKCIKETMRKYSIVPLILRQSSEDVTLQSGLVIPAGVTIAISPYAVHHDPAYYEKPRKWNPSNFDADKVAARPAYTFIPFGTGSRTCLGNKYGMTSMKVSLVALIRRFELSTTQTRFKLDHTFVTRCANGYHLQIRRRKPLDAAAS